MHLTVAILKHGQINLSVNISCFNELKKSDVNKLKLVKKVLGLSLVHFWTISASTSNY
jgi:hypothetical protein